MKWIELPLGPVTAQAFLAFPEVLDSNKPLPLVIAQHGIGSTPESTFKGGGYNTYAKSTSESRIRCTGTDEPQID